MGLYLNPIVQRVQNGTTHGGIDLCRSCRYALIRKGSDTGFEEIRCGQVAHMQVVPEPLAHCSFYLEKGKLALHEMVDIAYLLEKNKGVIGFLSPEELARRRDQASGGQTPSTAAPPRVGF